MYSHASKKSENLAPAILSTDLPPPPDLSDLPTHILHSGTIETLLSLNEDLMARLKVNVRRNGVIESQLLEQNRVNDELMRANSALMEQIEILREKDFAQRDRAAKAESQHSHLQEQLSFLELRFKAMEEVAQKRASSVRFEHRVRAWVRPFIDRLKSELAHARKALAAKHAVVSDLRANLAQATQHAQLLENRAARDQAKLVEQYETRQAQQVADLAKLRAEMKILREKSASIDQALAREAQATNLVIKLEREVNELKNLSQNYLRDARMQSERAVRLEGELEAARSIRSQTSSSKSSPEDMGSGAGSTLNESNP